PRSHAACFRPSGPCDPCAPARSSSRSPTPDHGPPASRPGGRPPGDGGCSASSLRLASAQLLDLDQMLDLEDHPTDGRSIFLHDRTLVPPQPQRPKGRTVLGHPANAAPDLRDPQQPRRLRSHFLLSHGVPPVLPPRSLARPQPAPESP